MGNSVRFYQLELRHRSAVWGDIGNLLKIEGLVIGGEGAQAVLMLPSTMLDYPALRSGIYNLSADEWSEWLQQSDNPEFFDALTKAFHRKVRYEISGAVQQKVWVADGFKCMFCGQKMGVVQLTIDHFCPLEKGGTNHVKNYLSACKKCNKDKGAMDPRDWCNLKGLDYWELIDYLAKRKLP